MEELDEFGIPIKKTSTPQSAKIEMDEFGIPLKKKEPSTTTSSTGYKSALSGIKGTSTPPTENGIKKSQGVSQSPLKTAATTTQLDFTRPQPRISAEEQQAQGMVTKQVKAEKALEFKEGVKQKLYDNNRYWLLQNKKEAQENGMTLKELQASRRKELANNYLDDSEQREANSILDHLDAKKSGDDKRAGEALKQYYAAKNEQRAKFQSDMQNLQAEYDNIASRIEGGELDADKGLQTLEAIQKRQKNLEIGQKAFLKPKEALKNFVQENATEIASVSKPTQTPYEQLEEYTNNLYAKVRQLKADLGYEDYGKDATLGGYAQDYAIRAEQDGGDLLDELYAEELKLKTATKLLLLNRTPIQADETALGVLGKSFGNSLAPNLQKEQGTAVTIANNVKEIVEDAKIGEKVYEEQKKFAEESAKPYETYSAKWFAEPVGASLAIVPEFIIGSFVSEGVLGVTKLGKLLTLAEKYGKIKGLNTTAKYVNAINKNAAGKVTGKLADTFIKAQANGLKFGATSEVVSKLFPSQEDELNFTTGYFGGVIGKGAESALSGAAKNLFKVFGNKGAEAAKKIAELGGTLKLLKDAPKTVLGEVGEEFGESLGQIYKQSSSWKEVGEKIKEQYGTLDKATEFVVLTGIMALGMGAGNSIGANLFTASKEAYNELPREQRAIVDSILDQAKAGDKQVEETVAEDIKKDIAKDLTPAELKEIETTTEETDEQRGIEEPISAGTDVLEEGVGMAVEPGKEGVAGEGIQAQKVLEPRNFKEETITEAIDSEREYLEKEILSEEQYIAERKNKKSKFRKILDKLSGVTYDKYLKAQQNRLSLLNENPLAYFEKELADEKKWQEKHPEDANENLINYLTEVVDNFKSREQAEEVPEAPLEEQQVPEEITNEYLLKTLPEEKSEGNTGKVMITTDKFGSTKTRYIPFEIIEQANKNDKLGGQTAKEINDRGGYSDKELDRKLPNWRTMLSKPEVVSEKVTEVTAPAIEVTPTAGSVGVGGEVDLGKNTIIVNMSLPMDSGVNTGLVKNSKGAVYHDKNTSKLEKLGYSKEQIDKLSQAELDEILAKNIENPNVETSAKMPLAEKQTTTQEFLNEANKEGGRFAELAKALKQFFGIDGVETEIVKGLKDFFGKNNDGDYANNKIRIDEKAKNKLQTFLHEAIHKVTVDKLLQFERGDYSKLSKQDIEAIQNLTRIFNESKAKIHEFLGGGKGDRTKGHYGFTNVHEFISEAFTNPEFQSLLKNLPTEGNNPTIFKQFLDAVAKFLGLKDASILNDIFYYTENLNNKAVEQSLKETPTEEAKPKSAAKVEPTKKAAKTEAKKSKPEQIGDGLLDVLGLEPVEPTAPAKKAGKKKPVNVSNKSELSELEGKAQGDKKTIIEAAKKAIATLKSVFPDMEIYIHEDPDSYNETMSEVGGVANSRGNFAFERDANDKPTGRGRIDINLSNAKDTTVAHELVHAVLLKAFGDNPAVFKAFRDRMSKILRADLNEQVTAFEKLYAGQDVAPEEYLTELAALLSQGGETVEYKPSTLRKVAALINEFVSRITKGKFQPFKSEVDFINFVGFLNQVSGAISEGGVIEQLNTQQAYSDGRAIQVPADFKAVKYKSEKVSKSQIGDYTFPSNIEILKISNLPIKTLEEVVKQYKGRVVIITSDATGYGVDSDGEPILGGAGFASNKINVNDGIGFASLNEGTVKGTYTRAEKAYGFGKTLVLIMVQPPHTTINNSYGAKYMLRGLLKIGELNATELEKTKNAIKNFVIKSKSVQEEFKSEAKKARDAEELKQAEIEINKLKKLKENGKVLTKEQNAAIKKYDAKIKKKEAEGKVEEVTKQRATQKALFELLDKIQPGADLNSLIKEFLNITTFTLRKEIGLGILPSSKETRTDKRTTYSKIAFNNINYSIYDFLKEYGDKTILTEDMMLNNKGGVLVGGFELDVTEVEQREKLIKEIQSKGILHPLFNAKLPGKNHFRLDDLYGAQENFGKYAVPDKVIDENKIGEDELNDLVRKIFTSNSDYEPKFRSIPLNERTYTHLKIANKTKFKDEVLAPKGFLKEKEADVATKVAKGEGFIPLPGAAEQMAEATMVSKPKDAASAISEYNEAPPAKKQNLKSKAQVAVSEETGFVPVSFWVEQLKGNVGYLDDVIKHILDARQELKEGKVTENKVAKAYLITLGSMGSGGGWYSSWKDKTKQTISDIFLEKKNGKDWIRPEGAAAAYLVTPEGKKLVKDIIAGNATQEQIKDLFSYIGFGRENSKSEYVVKTIARGDIKAMTDLFNKNKGRDFAELYQEAMKLEGIGEGKTGFFNQYFGVSERGVIDARELNAWVAGSMKLTPEQKEKVKKAASSKKLGDQLLGYIEQVGIELGYPKDLAGYIAHHAIWDAIANSVTTHAGEYSVVSKAQKAQTDKIKEFIDAQRKAGQSDKDIKAGLELVADKVGLTPEDINNLMGVESDEAKPLKGFKQKEKPAKETEGEKTGTRAFATKSVERAGVPIEDIPASLKNYIPTTVEEQQKIAEDFIRKHGIDNTITQLRLKDSGIDPKNKPVLASVLLKELYAEQNNTKDIAEIEKIAKDVHNVLDTVLTAATEAAQFMAMMREFYNSNPYNYVAQVTRLIEKNINEPIKANVSTAVVDINKANKNAAGQAASNVVKEVVTSKVTSAKEKFERSKANLKALWKKSFNIGIASNQYEAAKNDVQFAKALTIMAKDFVVYQSVQFSEFLKEVAIELGLKESDIDQDHLRKIFEKAKSAKIQEGIKVGLKELELKLKDLVESHYSASELEGKLIDKLKKEFGVNSEFGLNDAAIKELEEAIKREIKVLTAKEKIKALKALGIKEQKDVNEILSLSEEGLLNDNAILETLGDKLGIKKLTAEEAAKLADLAKDIKESKEDRIKARNIQKFEDYKFVLAKKYKIQDFLISNYLTNIFGSLTSNEKNIAGNVSETILLVGELMGNALASGNPKDIQRALKALVDGNIRGFDFTKEVLTTGVASYKEPGDIRARNMWELIMDRENDLTRIERNLQTLFRLPYLGPTLLAERRFWNRALLSMDSLSGTTNNELGSLLAATREADKQKLRGVKRTKFIEEQMANSAEAKEEARNYATSLGYKPGTGEFNRAVANYLVSKRPEAIKKAAAEYSARATLTQTPPPSTMTGAIANGLNDVISKNPNIKFFVPVVNTFANLIVKNIERSPFEFFSLAFDAGRAASGVESAKAGLTKAEVARRMKTAAVWTAISVLLFALAGGTDDDEEGFEVFGSGTGDPAVDNARRALGWKPNTVRFSKDGGYYNFEFLPFGFVLGMIGNMRDYFKYKNKPAFAIRQAQAKKIFGKNLDALDKNEREQLEAELAIPGKYNISAQEKKEFSNLLSELASTPVTYSFQLLKSLGELVNAVGEGAGAINTAMKSITNISRGLAAPRYLGEVRDIFDNKLYDSKEFRNVIGANVPFVKLGNVKLDAFGREIEKYKSESILSGIKYALTRGFYNPPTITPLDQFLWENGVGVSVPSNTPSMAYTEDVYREYIVTRGKILITNLTEALKNKEFEGLSPQDVLEVVNIYVTNANAEARDITDEKLDKLK